MTPINNKFKEEVYYELKDTAAVNNRQKYTKSYFIV